MSMVESARAAGRQTARVWRHGAACCRLRQFVNDVVGCCNWSMHATTSNELFGSDARMESTANAALSFAIDG